MVWIDIGLELILGAINSLQNITLFGEYKGPENMEYVHAAFKNVADQIDAIKTIEVNGKEYKLEK